MDYLLDRMDHCAGRFRTWAATGERQQHRVDPLGDHLDPNCLGSSVCVLQRLQQGRQSARLPFDVGPPSWTLRLVSYRTLYFSSDSIPRNSDHEFTG